MSQCSRECLTQNIVKDRTVTCYSCKNQIHLLCYGIEKAPEEIFVHKNIFMICNECQKLDFGQPSPERKTLVQRTIDMQSSTMTLGNPPINESPLNKSSTKSTTQSLIESLARKIDNNTMQ